MCSELLTCLLCTYPALHLLTEVARTTATLCNANVLDPPLPNSHTPLTHPRTPSYTLTHPHASSPFLTPSYHSSPLPHAFLTHHHTHSSHTPPLPSHPPHILTSPHTPTTHSHLIYPHAAAQNAAVGEKEVWYSSRVLVEGGDAQMLYVGETVTLLNWGNLVITAIDK